MRLTLKEWDVCQAHLIQFWKAQAEAGDEGLAARSSVMARANDVFSFFFGRRRKFSKETVVELQPGPTPMVQGLTAQKRVVVDPRAGHWTALFGADWDVNGTPWAEGLIVWPWPPEALRFADESVDVMLAVNMLDQVRHPEAVAQEVIRVLKPGGWLCVENYLQKGRPVSPPQRATHPHDFDRDDLVGLFEGLTLIKENLQEWDAPAAYPRWRGKFRKPR